MEKRKIRRAASSKRLARRRGLFALGLAVVLCILVGIVFLSGSLIRFFVVRNSRPPKEPATLQEELIEPDYHAPLDFSALKEGTIVQNGALLNFAKHEFPPFLTADEIPMEHLISFGIWEALKSEEFSDSITYLETGAMVVPAKLVTQTITRHFLLTKYIIHQSVDVHGAFTYDSTAKTYTVPVFGLYDTLVPRIMSLEKTENGYVLEVDYLQSGEQEAVADSKSALEPVRQARLTLRQEEDDLIFVSQTNVVNLWQGEQAAPREEKKPD